MKEKKSALLIVAILSLAITAAAIAEQPQRPGDDPIGSSFFSPELIMDHQADIALKDSQRQTIIGEIKKMQSNTVEMQFKIKAAMQELVSILGVATVDEVKAVEALHKLTKIENEMKSMHITLMIRIKNTLTKEQQEKLRTFAR